MKYALLFILLITAGCATALRQNQPLEITVTNDACLIDGQAVALSELSDALSSTDSVLLRCDKTLPHKRVASVMNECAEANVTNVTFAVAQQ